MSLFCPKRADSHSVVAGSIAALRRNYAAAAGATTSSPDVMRWSGMSANAAGGLTMAFSRSRLPTWSRGRRNIGISG
jgi:hypothetical protein